MTEQYAKLGETAAEASGVLNVSATATTVNSKDYYEATNLGSIAVSAASPSADTTKTMKGYLSPDITAATAAEVTAGTTKSQWKVYVADGKVTRITYTRDGVALDDLIPSSAIK